MKSFAVIIILISLIVSGFSKVLYYADYALNTGKYAKNCVNKARPMMHCNGHCQLSKKLKQEENKDKQNPERRNNGKEEVISSKSFFASIEHISSLALIEHKIANNNSVIDISESIFHPPTA